MRRRLALTGCLIAVADALSTLAFLHRGTGVEGNPVVAWAMTLVGVPLALTLFTLLRFAALHTLALIGDSGSWPRVTSATLWLLVLGTGWVVWHNLQGI